MGTSTKVIVIPRSGYIKGKVDGAGVKGPFPADFEAMKRRLIADVKWLHQCGAYCYMPRGKTLDETIAHINQLTLAECYERAVWLHETRMANFPSDLSRLPELKGRDQYEEDYQWGFMEASGLRYEEYCWHRNQLSMRMFAIGFTNQDSPFASCCSEILFLRTPKGPIFCRSYDATMTLEDQPPHAVPQKLGTTITIYEGDEGYAQVGYHTNEKNFFSWGGGGGVYEYETCPEPQFYFNPDLNRYCANIAEAKDMLKRYRLYLGQPNQGVVADLSTGEAFGYDHSKADVGFFEPNEQGVVFNTWGGATVPELRKLCDPTNPLFAMYDRRMKHIRDTVEAAGDDLNEEVMWRCVLDHNANWCNHYEQMGGGIPLWSCGCLLFYLATGHQQSRITYWNGKRYVHPCEMESTHSTFRVMHDGGLFIGKPSEWWR